MRLTRSMPMHLHCDYQAAIHIASNTIFHERTKHILVYCNFMHELVNPQYWLLHLFILVIRWPIFPSNLLDSFNLKVILGSRAHMFDIITNSRSVKNIHVCLCSSILSNLSHSPYYRQ